MKKEIFIEKQKIILAEINQLYKKQSELKQKYAEANKIASIDDKVKRNLNGKIGRISKIFVSLLDFISYDIRDENNELIGMSLSENEFTIL